MSKVEELERLIEKLSPDDFARLSAWMVQRHTILIGKGAGATPRFRDHVGFLNSYSPEGEGASTTMPKAGEIWLADIPFTSGSASKVRPVLVLWEDAADVVVAAVT